MFLFKGFRRLVFDLFAFITSSRAVAISLRCCGSLRSVVSLNAKPSSAIASAKDGSSFFDASRSASIRSKSPVQLAFASKMLRRLRCRCQHRVHRVRCCRAPSVWLNQLRVPRGTVFCPYEELHAKRCPYGWLLEAPIEIRRQMQHVGCNAVLKVWAARIGNPVRLFCRALLVEAHRTRRRRLDRRQVLAVLPESLA